MLYHQFSMCLSTHFIYSSYLPSNLPLSCSFYPSIHLLLASPAPLITPPSLPTSHQSNHQSPTHHLATYQLSASPHCPPPLRIPSSSVRPPLPRRHQLDLSSANLPPCGFITRDKPAFALHTHPFPRHHYHLGSHHPPLRPLPRHPPPSHPRGPHPSHLAGIPHTCVAQHPHTAPLN